MNFLRFVRRQPPMYRSWRRLALVPDGINVPGEAVRPEGGPIPSYPEIRYNVLTNDVAHDYGLPRGERPRECEALPVWTRSTGRPEGP